MWLQTTRTVEVRSIDDPPPQPSNPKETTSTPAPQSSQSSTQNLSTPSVVKAGEIMLIFSLLLIFLVACTVATHFWLRSRKRKAKRSRANRAKNKKKKGGPAGPPELHSQEKKIAELVGTPVCEMGDSEPRHEMEDVEVQEALTPIDEPIGSAISTFGHIAIPVAIHIPAPEPDAREFASYWSLRM